MFEKSKSSNFRDYVNSLTSDDTIYLVDIGWKGTIQDNIQRALSDKIIIGVLFWSLNIKIMITFRKRISSV